MLTTTDVVVDHGNHQEHSSPSVARIERLLMQQDCWTGARPADVDVPKHAVVTLPGQRPRLVSADTGFGIWLEGGAGILHGFCR